MRHLVATAEEVIAFNRLYKWMRGRRGHSGLEVQLDQHRVLLRRAEEAPGGRRRVFRVPTLPERARRAVAAARKADRYLTPKGIPAGHRSRRRGRRRGPDRRRLRHGGRPRGGGCQGRAAGSSTGSGASILFKQEGRAQPGTLAGHEHFGFLDGVRRRACAAASHDPHDVLTPRQNPTIRTRASPARSCLARRVRLRLPGPGPQPDGK